MTLSLVWGGAGFIGSHLCEALLARGHRVICADNLVTGSRQNVAHLFASSNFRFLLANVIEPLHLPEKVSFIFHLASPASMPAIRRDPFSCIAANTIGTQQVLAFAARHEAVAVLASTSEVYGEPEISPQQEAYRGNVNTLGPRSCYDEAKRLLETIAYEHSIIGVDVRLIRIFNTYGPRLPPDDGRVIPRFFLSAYRNQPLRIFGDGSATRSFCFVSDQVAGFLAMADAVPAGLRVCNVGAEDEISMSALAHRIVTLTGSNSQVLFETARVDDPRQRRPDISRAKLELGWTPKISLEDGLRKSATYFKDIALKDFVDIPDV